MARILFFAHDPGGANTLVPIIDLLKEKGHKLFIYGHGPALKILSNVVDFNGDTDKLINDIKPDFVITGTSASDMIEKKLRLSARKIGVQSLSILDHWVNFGIRFSKYAMTQKA